MKKRNLLIVFLVFMFGMAACSPAVIQIKPFSREKVAENIASLLNIEKRSDQVIFYAKMLGNLGDMNKEIVEK